VRWQRLVNESGQTCPRCGDTQREVRLAADTLRRCLRPLNMEVALEETPMTSQAFLGDTSQSNRIWVNDRPLAEWLGGTVGMSSCRGCCPTETDVKCRTLTVGGQTYEAIPADLIVRAGLLAADASLAARLTNRSCGADCGTSAGQACCLQSGPSANRAGGSKAPPDRRR
jgi:hypothetical protein